MGNIIYSKQFGKCKRFNILPWFWIEIRKEFIFYHNQWCLGYKVFKVGFLAIYYHSPI